MGEGHTPVVVLELAGRSIPAKLEFESPTSSFKDRGAAMVIAAAIDLGATHVVADSSGNAGVAIATYAAHAGLACDVFVPSTTPLAKVGRISEAGAVVHAVNGPREAAAAAAQVQVESVGAFYASHVWNPWFFEGTKSYVAELRDQLVRVPSTLVLPVGNGTLVLGAERARRELNVTFRIVAVQAQACAPIAAALAAGSASVAPVPDGGTLAAGIAISAPVRGDEILEVLRASGGTVITVTDDELRAAQRALADRGFDVEPTAAAPAAALAHLDDDDLDDVVIPIASGQRSSSHAGA